MTAKEKIDKYIGEIPNLKQVNKIANYQFSTDIYINEAYWKGYIQAKEELRDKLYAKENIKPVVEETNGWSPDYNLSIFGEHIYDRK
jgi:hypothetical protein